MEKLQIDLGELVTAFEDATRFGSYYLDLETGKVLWITRETFSELERIFEETCDPESEEPVDLAAVLQDHDIPDWQKEGLLEADRVECLEGSRYVGLPDADSREAYRDMERFIVTVQDERLQDHLWRAIGGRGAFRYFKDVLANHHRERERWHAFQQNQTRERILDCWSQRASNPSSPSPRQHPNRNQDPRPGSGFWAKYSPLCGPPACWLV